MQPVVTVAEMRAADADAPVPAAILIDRAGRAVANRAMQIVGGAYGTRIVVVAGKGNNGADGRAAARVLTSRGARVAIVEPGADVPAGADLVIDGAFGTGFRGSYRAPTTAAPVLAIDIASGVDGDTGAAGDGAVTAAATVTMAARKPGLLLGDGPARSGAVTVADIGLPVAARAHLVEDCDLGWIPARARDTHKWTRAVWVVAGSPGMRGAPALCVRAAQRAGAGMVRVGSPGLLASEHPAGEAVAVGLADCGWEDTVLGELDRFRALVVGPGLGRADATATAVRRLVERAGLPVVVDADGLHALGQPGALRAAGEAPVVLTPHDGEFTRLAGHAPGPDRIAAGRALAARTGAVVLLKGPTTVVAEPDGRVLLAAAGDARLATAGTGDVLAGVVGAFLAAGVPAFEAAALAAHVHGRAAARGRRVGLVAGDLPDLLPPVLEGR
ncbi:MAG: NAD(P)H-hydrate dehydratase [Acidimicrobiales bacterium]